MRRIRYGSHVAHLAHVLGSEIPAEDDLTFAVAKHLAMAWEYMEQLEKAGEPVEFNGQPLVKPNIERAWRELLHLRQRVTTQGMDVALLSRYGRVVVKK